MPVVTYVESNGTPHRVEVGVDQSVMEGSILNEVPGIVALCGGICSCATCHCYVPPDWEAKIPPPSEGERAMLAQAFDRRPNSRLGCQIIVTPALDGLVVHLPAHQAAGED